MRELRDRVAVVTGAASGIGLALTESFVGEGMRVVMADIDEQALMVHAQRLGESVRPVVTDVSDQESVERAGLVALDTFGALHVAVNNAGIVNGGNSWELSLEEWHRVLDTNLWGVIHGVRAFVPLILAAGDEGHVVNTSSMAAVLGLPGIGPYTVAKHGVLGLSDVLRAELEATGAPVGVSVVMPGMIRTGMNPVGLVEPSSVAANVLDAMRRGRPYVFTDDHSTKQVEDRLQAILAARADVLSKTPREI
jgi:NAD(P)-dependent dehydrogenase (short-subunit alcohol dehydrogenase family)